MKKIIEKAKALINALSDDIDDYPDHSSYRMVKEREHELKEAINQYEQQNGTGFVLDSASDRR
jgi:hypothetical protein